MQTENALEVAGTLTLSELVRFQYFHAFRRSWWMVAFLCLVAGVLLLLAGFLAWFAPGEGFTPSGWMVPLALVLFWGIVITAPYRGAKRLMRTSATLSGPTTYAFQPDGIRHGGQSFSSEVAYAAIWLVRETKTLYLLYLSVHSALVLPKRYFKDAAQQSGWRSMIEEKISPKTIEPPGFLARRL